MSSKIDVTEIVRDHYATLVDGTTGRRSRLDYSVLVVVPLLLGGVLAYENSVIHGVADLLAGVAVFSGALFAALLQVFSLSERLTSEPRFFGQQMLGQRIDELESNTSYAFLVSLLVVAALMAASATGQSDHVARWLSAVCVALLAHMLFTCLMVLKRLRALYEFMKG